MQLPEPSWVAAIQALCGDASRAEDFVRDVFEAERPALVGELDFRTTLQDVLCRWGSPVQIDEALRIWHRIQPDSQAFELIGELRRCGRTVALASNQQMYRAAYMRDTLGYGAHFDQLLFSCDLRFAKPDHRYFDAALRQLAARPDQVLFVDDHLPNVEAARSLGIAAELFHLREGTERLRSVLISRGVLPADLCETVT